MSIYTATGQKKTVFERIHLDGPLLFGLIALMGFGLIVMWSASGEGVAMMERQIIRMTIAFCIMIILAQIPPRHYEVWAPYLYFTGIGLLICVLLFGETAKGAQRWLNLGFFTFQPSELIKLALIRVNMHHR